MDKQETKQKLQPEAEPIDNAVPLESRIHLLTIIGEVEGHESLGDRTKSTKYEEILPRLALIEDDEQIEFLNDLGISESGVSKLIKESYNLLGLMSFLTAGPEETRAWTIKIGTNAVNAAGKIHSDIQRGFICKSYK